MKKTSFVIAILASALLGGACGGKKAAPSANFFVWPNSPSSAAMTFGTSSLSKVESVRTKPRI